MPCYIALLRGINVSGQKIIKMEDLRRYFTEAGCAQVQTYIQSGNVVFQHDEADAERLRAHIEAELEAKLGYAVPTLLRTHAQLQAIVAANPFSTDWADFGKKAYVIFLENAPADDAVASLMPYVKETEKFEVRAGEGYVYYDEGLGKSKFSNVIIERKLGRATMRNWNTVTTLLEMSK